jgi:hypothetical protein
MRRHKFNVDGFRGVTYDSEWGYYRVLVCDGYWVRWLEGDELPGGSASIWFSDLARAVSARDNEERCYRDLMEARRREDIIASAEWEQERIQTEGYAGWDLW